jgi:hypothetical protein
VIECTDEMLAAFMQVMMAPNVLNETVGDLYKNGIEAAIAAIPKDKPEPEPPILGYLPGGKRIGPCQPGRIYTACVVSCVGCHKVIRGMGGPLRGAMCLDCWEAAGL